MDFTPIAPIDIKGNVDSSLIERADQLIIDSAKLTGSYSQIIIDTIRDQLRITNSYYSNRIESEGTHPLEIEAAMKRKFSDDAKARDLQMLSLAHIETQQWVEKQFSDGSVTSPYSQDFIEGVHRHLYSQEGMEPFLQIMDEGRQIKMQPGELRKHDVSVAKHIAPKMEEVGSLMMRYADLYDRSLTRPMGTRFIHLLASHHRLLWIHPFIDGNGRTARLALDGAFYATGIEGYGLWNISRGLARNIDEYRSVLKHADMIRQGSLDGRGALSSGALKEFVMFMLTCAEDQVDFMGRYLKLDKLTERLDAYVRHTQAGMFDMESLPKNSNAIFKELLMYGEINRGRVPALIGAKERTGSKVIKELTERGYLTSNMPKGPIRLKIGTHLANYLFPGLVPEV